MVDIDFNGKPIPSLADKWETDDGRNWKFFLRKDVYFADNTCFQNSSEKHFNAQDVKYSFERLLNNNSKSLGVSYFTNIKGVVNFREGKATEIEGIKIIDDYTIAFHLNAKEYSLPALLTLPYASIVKKTAVEYYGGDFKSNPVGTGPFILNTYEPDAKIVLSRNNNYWEQQDESKLPLVDKVIIHLTSDDNLSFLMFKDQKTDFLELSFPILKQLEMANFNIDFEIQTCENAQLNFYLFNLNRLADAKLRNMITRMLDRDKIQEIISKSGTIAKSVYPQSIFPQLSFPQKSLEFDTGNDPSSQKTKSLKLVSFEDVLSKSLVNFIGRNLREQGIKVEIESVPFPVLVDRLGKGDYDLIQIYWGPLYVDACHYLNPFLTASFPPSGNNFNKYSNSQFDNLVTKAKLSEREKRKELLLQAEQVILGDMPILPLYFKSTTRVSNKRFDMPLHPLQYRMYKLAKARE